MKTKQKIIAELELRGNRLIMIQQFGFNKNEIDVTGVWHFFKDYMEYLKEPEHTTVKYIECECGEDVYEDDRYENTPEGKVQCISCGVRYDQQKLINKELPNVQEI